MSRLIRRSGETIAVSLAVIVLLSARVALAACLGDCNGNGVVSAGELTKIITIINLCGGTAAGCPAVPGTDKQCTNGDKNGNGIISAGELTNIIFNIINFSNSGGCPVATATPTPPAPTPTQTGGGGPSFCGNGVVDAGETCDDGGACFGGPDKCFGGANDGQVCTSPVQCPGGMCHPSIEGQLCTSQAQCPGGECRGFGADGCAVNCTPEETMRFEFTGAVCLGGATDGQACAFQATCQNAGALTGRRCKASSECGSGTCVSECGTSAGSMGCFADGECTSGTNMGAQCYTVEGVLTPVNQCAGGSNAGRPCVGDANCPGSTCSVNPCGPAGGTCEPRTRAALQSMNIPVKIGPLIGYQDFHVGKAGADGLVPVTIPATGTFFRPVKVTGILCACVRGNVDAGAHGPGNSGSGYIACGAAGLANDVTLAKDHNTTLPGVCQNGPNVGTACTTSVPCESGNTCNRNNGPGQCTAGPVVGRMCTTNAHCGTGGTCSNKAKGGGACMGPPKFCVGGDRAEAACFNDTECPGGSCPGSGNFLGYCDANADCPGSLCNSVDDTLACVAQDPPLPAGSGGKACLERREVCTSGPNLGQLCTDNKECGVCAAGSNVGAACALDSDCPGGGTGSCTLGKCATECNTTVPTNAHVGLCNGPTHLQISGSGATGAGFFLTTTAIGQIQDTGKCDFAGRCVGGSKDGAECEVSADCPSPGTCAVGKCDGGANNGQACSVAAGCPGGTCKLFEPEKGVDGLPCTDDDPVSTRGVAQTIPTTTGTSSTTIVDVFTGATSPGELLANRRCSSGLGASCITALTGTVFSCPAVTSATPSASGVRLASTFPALDQAVGDSAVTTFLTAK